MSLAYPVLKCCVCGKNEILAPPGTVLSSRFFCRGCCELIWIARHIAEARDILHLASNAVRGKIPNCEHLHKSQPCNEP